MDLGNHTQSDTDNPYRPPKQAGAERLWPQFSLLPVFASIGTFGAGVALMRITPALSLFNLVGLFVVGASFGIPFGYGRAKWSGAVRFAILTGATVLALFILACFAGVFEADPPPPPPPLL